MKSYGTENRQGLTASNFDFKESGKFDSTHGWVPFALLIAIAPIVLAVMGLASYWFQD